MYSMKHLTFCSFLLLSFCLLCANTLHAAYILKNGRLINVKNEAYLSVEEHFEKGLAALNNGDLDTAQTHMRIIHVNFQNHSLGIESIYYLGVIAYRQDELDEANKLLSSYLKADATKAHFEDSYRFKVSIAERFIKGERRHLFTWSVLPKWQTGRGIALDILEETDKALPNHELAAVALLQKSSLFLNQGNFTESEKTLQQIIKRFPLSSFSKQAFATLSDTLKKQLSKEPQNMDLLDMAHINEREFTQAFGKEDKQVREMDLALVAMKETRAQSLFETGQLFERKNKPKAAVIYYALVIASLPQTSVYQQCVERLKGLSSYATEMHIPVPL